jgi:SAM-dependent methyltransferase
MPDARTSIVRSGYDLVAERYLAWIPEIVGDPRARFLGELIDRVPAGGSALDLGCGAGVPATAQLAEHCSVVGVDISEAQLQLARKRVPDATFVRGDLFEVVFPERAFDAISAFYAISHVPRDLHAELLRRIASWLKPGGWFLASMGAGGCPDTTEHWLGVEMFFSSHDADTNRQLVRDAGFTLELDEIVTMREPEGEASFLWILGQRR